MSLLYMFVSDCSAILTDASVQWAFGIFLHEGWWGSLYKLVVNSYCTFVCFIVIAYAPFLHCVSIWLLG